MSSTYSRNSWPYKNIVISFFFFNSSTWLCSPGAEVEAKMRGRKRGGTGCVCEGDGLIEGGRKKGGPTVTDCPSQCRLQ